MAGSYYERNCEKWVGYREKRRTEPRPRCASETLCEGREFARGFCHKHYKRWLRHGALFSPKALDGLRTKTQRSRAYYEAHREERIAYQKARRDADPEVARAYEREVYQRRRDKAQASNRARERSMESLDAESLNYDAILRFDPCSYCGALMEHVDHIDAVAHGGRNHWTNLTAACQPCNRAKSDKPLLTALLERTPA